MKYKGPVIHDYKVFHTDMSIASHTKTGRGFDCSSEEFSATASKELEFVFLSARFGFAFGFDSTMKNRTSYLPATCIVL